MRRGLDLPVPGSAHGDVEPVTVRSVGVLGADHPGLHLRPLVAVGDLVQLGQPVLEDRRWPALRVTSPGSGRVAAIHAGERRSVEALVVSLGEGGERRFERNDPRTLAQLPRAHVVRRLLESGLWCALRTRPLGRIPDPTAEPTAIFVTALDTQPLAPPPELTLVEHPEEFGHGLALLGTLTPGPIYLCRRAGAPIEAGPGARVSQVEVSGPHPAGLAGTHVHHLHRATRARPVWTLGYADVIAFGTLFGAGRLWTERIVSVSGPGVGRPRHVRARLGASTEDLVRDAAAEGPCHIVSGSLLVGRNAAGHTAFLGHRHLQVSVLPEAQERERAPWWGVGRRGRARRLVPWPGGPARFASRNPELPPGPFFPASDFERVFPLDLPVLPLLRALVAGDLESAAACGALELVEEDLALCSFVCPSHIDYGAHLRRVLDRLEAEA